MGLLDNLSSGDAQGTQKRSSKAQKGKTVPVTFTDSRPPKEPEPEPSIVPSSTGHNPATPLPYPTYEAFFQGILGRIEKGQDITPAMIQEAYEESGFKGRYTIGKASAIVKSEDFKARAYYNHINPEMIISSMFPTEPEVDITDITVLSKPDMAKKLTALIEIATEPGIKRQLIMDLAKLTGAIKESDTDPDDMAPNTLAIAEFMASHAGHGAEELCRIVDGERLVFDQIVEWTGWDMAAIERLWDNRADAPPVPDHAE